MKELGISQYELGSLETLLWKYVLFFELEDELISEEVEFCNRSLLLLGALTDSEVLFGKISWVQLLFTKMVFDTSRGIMKMIRNEKYHATKTARVTKTGCRIQLEYLKSEVLDYLVPELQRRFFSWGSGRATDTESMIM